MAKKLFQQALVLLACLALSSLTFGQVALQASADQPAPLQAHAELAERRAKAEAELAETQRKRNAELPSVGDITSVESVTAADRQRLLDFLVYLQGKKIEKLAELAALRKMPAFVPAALPQVLAIGAAPPYSAVAVDALRDELDGLREKLQGLVAGVQLREADKQLFAEHKRRADEALRLSNDRLATARGDAGKVQAKREREQAALRQQVAEAQLAVLAIDEDCRQLQASQLRSQSDELARLVSRVLPAQRLSAAELEELRLRMLAMRKGLSDELTKVSERRRNHQDERARLQTLALAADSEGGQRLLLLEQALITDGIVLDGLNGLMSLAEIAADVWGKRYLVLADSDKGKQHLALAAMDKIYQGLVSRKGLSLEQRNVAQAGIREQEARVSTLLPDSREQRQAKEILSFLHERASMHERLEVAASRLERQLARWNGDFIQMRSASLSGQALLFGERVLSALRTFWQYELFAVEDTSDIDGQKVKVSYGVTVGKSIGALMLFVLGYWLFSRLAQRLEGILVRRFGINTQLASVLRRWAMILLALVLIVFVLNLARIPLTVFAFMGGALAIGVGFGTQTIIKNFISGIIILFERKIRVGDIVELGGMAGHVTAVDLRATTVRGFDGVEALVPNSNFLDNQVVNWTYSNQQIRRELRIGVAYGTDSRGAESILLSTAIDHPNVLETPAPEVFLEDFACNALLMVLVFWVELGPNMVARRVDSDLRHTIYERLGEAGIAIPFAQQDVHLDLALPLPVVVTGKNGGIGVS